jgi:indole-3-glycerol phosphate synthase
VSYLRPILESTRARIADLTQRVTADVLEQRLAAAEPPRGFAAALTGEEVAIIAEIKRASPATGPLDPDLNAARLAKAYAEGGAAAISVLTEPDHFGGSLEDLEAGRAAGLPVLRKDFVLDELQVLESRAVGADAVLLIVKALGGELDGLVAVTETLGMDALVEVHDEAELERAVDVGARLIGVNHRNLDTFEVDPDRTAKLAGLVPPEAVLVALSGVTDRAGIKALAEAGAAAVLVGESLVRAPDAAAKLRALRGRDDGG